MLFRVSLQVVGACYCCCCRSSGDGEESIRDRAVVVFEHNNDTYDDGRSEPGSDFGGAEDAEDEEEEMFGFAGEDEILDADAEFLGLEELKADAGKLVARIKGQKMLQDFKNAERAIGYPGWAG